MARPQLPASSSRPTYFGGTPTSPTGYDRPDLLRDYGWQEANRPSGLDFSDTAIAERERLAREQAIANLQSSRQLVADAGPQGFVAPGIDVEGLGIGVSTPTTQERQAYIAYTIALQGSRASNLLKYPTLAQAAIEAGIDEKDLARLVNYAEADAGAERLLGAFALLYNEEGDEAKAALGQYQVDNILKSANPIMKAAIMDVLGEKIKELEAPGGSDSATWADTVIENAGKILEVVFTPFEMANQASQQAFRAVTYGSQVEQTNTAGPLGPIQNIWEYWDKVGEGQYDQKLLGAAKQEFGPLAVDLVLEVEKKTREGDPDPLISLFAEKSGDPEAMKLIADMLYGDGSEGVDFAEVSRAVDNAALFNTGQLLISSIVGTNGLGSVSRDKFANLSNIVATLALDPTIAGAKVRSAYIATRFALEKVAPGASRAGVAAAFNMRPTRRYFTKLFDDLDRYDELAARDPGAASVLREQIRRQFPEIPDDTIELFITDGVRTVDALVDWTVETNAMFTMARGRSAAGMIGGDAEAAVVDPLAVAMAERGAALTRSQLLPRMGGTYARRARQRFARMVTPLTPQRRGKAVIAEAYGDTSDPALLAAAGVNPEIAMKAGALERGGMVSGVPGALGKKVDTTFKYFSSIGLGYVNIVDGRDARTIYRYARTYLSRRHATYWADMWRKATPSQRYDMLIGLNRTTASAKGLDLTDPEMLARVDELITPTAKSRTSFSAKSPGLRPVGPNVEDEVSAFAATGEDLYHGTNRNFDAFDEDLAQARGSRSLPRTGGGRSIYFSEDEQVAGTFSREAGDSMVLPEPDSVAWSDFVWQKGNGDPRAAIAQVLDDARDNGRPMYALIDGRQSTDPDEILDYIGLVGDSPLLFPEGQAPQVIKATVYGRSLNLRVPNEAYESDVAFQRWIDENVPADLQAALRAERVGTSNAFEAIFNRYNPLGYYHESSKALVDWARANGYGKILVNDSGQSGGKSVIAVPEMIAYGKNDPVAAFRDTLAREVVDPELSIPSLFPDGSEKALFGWQTASHVALPNIAEVEKLGRWQRFVSEHGGTIGEAIIASPQRITDMWSLGTLFGLRFALRSAVEDWWFYAVITGGNLGDLYKGRRMSTMLREARGRTRATATSGGKKEVAALGMFNRRARAVGTQLENSQNEVARTIGSWIRGNLDPEDVAAAHSAALKGDFEPMRRMAALALAKSRVTFINEAEKGYFLDLVDGPFGMKLLDDLAEGGKNINSGGIADNVLDVPGTEAAGVDVMAVPRTKDAVREGPTGVYTPELPVEDALDESFLYWERGIRGVLLQDGPAGRIAVAYLDDPEEAIRRVADEIRTDPTGYGYSWRFAALRDESPESFAARKVQAVRGLFSDAQGNLNQNLWRRVVKDDRSVVAYETAEDGTKTFNIDLATLRGVPKDMRPAYVSGQKFGTIPVPNGLAPFLDRSWTWMGEQYARISREPIFLANYLSQRKQLAGVQAQLTAEIGDRAARRVVSRMAEDRAYTFTLSYMDNPQNRSLLAYKIRNVSRYYRATEDFYRRMMRAGKNYPVGFWKTALIYDVLDDTGFVYTDDNGDKYFMYPATSELMGAMNWALGKISGQEGLDMKFPFVLGGKVRMLAPSSDPNQMAASLAGPMGTMSYKLLARRFPSLSRLNRLVLGEYGTTGQGSVVDDFSASFLPGQLQNLIRTLNDDEVDSMVAAAAKDALTIAVVNDLIPEDENSVEFTNAMAKIDLIAWSAVVTRMVFGFVAPASPQRLTTNISEYARLNRVIAPRPAFLKLVQKRADEGMENPVGAALADWWQLDQDMLPYTVSRTQDVKGGTRGLAELKTSLAVLDWFNENRSGLIEKYPTTAYFLAPQDEGFDWNTWGLIKAEGLRMPKAILNPDGTPGAFLRDMFAAKGESQHYATIADYQRDIEALDPRDPEQYKQMRALEEQRSADLEWIRDANPYWDMKYTQTRNFGDNQRNAERALTQTKRMVDELYESTPEAEWKGSPAQAIRNAILTYVDYANEIRATSGTDTDSEMKRRYLRIGLQEDLDYLASLNPNAKLFIRNVLMADPDVKVLDLELVGASSG